MNICDTRIMRGFELNCGYRSKAGIVESYFINFDDIDRKTTLLTASGGVISNLILKEGAKIYPFRGDKRTKASAEGKPTDFGDSGYTHNMEYFIQYYGFEQRELMSKIDMGARLVAIIKKADKGKFGELEYEVVGFESGMKMAPTTRNFDENSGAKKITFATEENAESSDFKLLNFPSEKEQEDFFKKYIHEEFERV